MSISDSNYKTTPLTTTYVKRRMAQISKQYEANSVTFYKEVLCRK